MGYFKNEIGVYTVLKMDEGKSRKTRATSVGDGDHAAMSAITDELRFVVCLIPFKQTVNSLVQINC